MTRVSCRSGEGERPLSLPYGNGIAEMRGDRLVRLHWGKKALLERSRLDDLRYGVSVGLKGGSSIFERAQQGGDVDFMVVQHPRYAHRHEGSYSSLWVLYQGSSVVVLIFTYCTTHPLHQLVEGAFRRWVCPMCEEKMAQLGGEVKAGVL